MIFPRIRQKQGRIHIILPCFASFFAVMPQVPSPTCLAMPNFWRYALRMKKRRRNRYIANGQIRAVKATELYLAGETHQAIADAVGYSRNSVGSAIDRGLALIGKYETAKRLRRGWTIRLNRLCCAHYRRANPDSHDYDPSAHERLLKYLDRLIRIAGLERQQASTNIGNTGFQVIVNNVHQKPPPLPREAIDATGPPMILPLEVIDNLPITQNTEPNEPKDVPTLGETGTNEEPKQDNQQTSQDNPSST